MGGLESQLRIAPTWARLGLGLILSAPLLACYWFTPFTLVVLGAVGLLMAAVGGRDLIASSGGSVSVASLLLVVAPFAVVGLLLGWVVCSDGAWTHFLRRNEWAQWIWIVPAVLEMAIGIELAARRSERARKAFAGAFGLAFLLAAIAPFADLVAIQ